MKKIFIVAFLILPLLPPPSWGDEPSPQGAKPVRVSFQLLKTQHMVVNVKINGKGPYRLIFDTGAPITLINNKIAKESEVLPKNFRPPFFAPFGSMGQFTIKALELGSLKAENVPTMVMDHPTVAAMARVLGPIEGIVGFGFFARFRMTLDYQAKVMTFTPSSYQPPDMMDKMMKLVLFAGDANTKKVLAPAGQWGFRVGKNRDDMEPGVDVKEVLPGSPAALAGLKTGDRLLTLDGSWTDSVSDCYTAAGPVQPGAEATLVIRRNGKEKELRVKVQAGL